MSNNPTPPRIEREAEIHIRRIDASGKTYAATYPCQTSDVVFQALWTGYSKGALEEVLRAAPVVKALEKMYKDYHEFMTYKERMDLKQILETYKADV